MPDHKKAHASSSTWVKGVLDMFASQGLNTTLLLESAKIDAADLDAPDARIGADEVSLLWSLAVAQSGNPTLGLDPDLAARYVNFDVVGYAMLSSQHLGAGLHNLARYLALVSDAATFNLEPLGDRVWLTLGHAGNSQPVPRQRQEFGLLALLELCQWLTRSTVRPLAAEFIFSEPASRRPYEKAFCTDLKFHQPSTRLLLSAHHLALPIPTRNADLLALHERLLDDRLVGLGNASTSYRVSHEIMRVLSQGEPRRGTIAKALNLTDRTLQRRLSAEGTSFQQLLDDVRQLLARQYLADERYPSADIADLLGFSEQTNFFRACRRWFNQTPGQYRTRFNSDEETNGKTPGMPSIIGK